MFSANTKEAADITKDLAANDIKRTANSVKRDLRNGSAGIVDDISDYANQAGQKARMMIDSASDELEHAGEQISREIRRNPLRSGLIAVGTGIILGMLFRR